MPVSLYAAKKALLSPRTACRRRQAKDVGPLARSMLELHHYGRPMYDFMAATMEKPDLLYDVDLDAGSVVLDVGAFDGDWSEKISQRSGSTIYAFEPNPNAYRKMADRLAAYPDVASFDYGLGGRSEVGSLILRGPGSSMYGDSESFDRADVQIRDIVAVLDELHVEKIDLMKVNIEGGEYDLFDRLIESDWLDRIEVVSVQFHEWHPKAYRRRRVVRRALRSAHTEVWNYPWVWELWRRVAD